MKDVLQKIIAQSGMCSRRKAEVLISQGKVKLNGRVAQLGDRASYNDQITVSGLELFAEEKCYFRFYKPRGVISSLARYKNEKSLKDYLPSQPRLFPVGRLDKDSEGLLLLTNDGVFANLLMHPRYEHEKRYEVTLDGLLHKEDLEKFQNGFILEGKKTLPAKIRKLPGKNLYLITLKEGRKRIIRKMALACGLTVIRLVRVNHAGFALGDLQPGMIQPLKKSEVKRVVSHTRLYP